MSLYPEPMLEALPSAVDASSTSPGSLRQGHLVAPRILRFVERAIGTQQEGLGRRFPTLNNGQAYLDGAGGLITAAGHLLHHLSHSLRQAQGSTHIGGW